MIEVNVNTCRNYDYTLEMDSSSIVRVILEVSEYSIDNLELREENKRTTSINELDGSREENQSKFKKNFRGSKEDFQNIFITAANKLETGL